MENKLGPMVVSYKFFGSRISGTGALESFRKEWAELSELSKLQLASAAARALSIPQSDCAFTFVPY